MRKERRRKADPNIMEKISTVLEYWALVKSKTRKKPPNTTEAVPTA